MVQSERWIWGWHLTWVSLTQLFVTLPPLPTPPLPSGWWWWPRCSLCCSAAWMKSFLIMISRSLGCPICDQGGHVVCACVCLSAYLPTTIPKGNWGTLCCKVSNSKVFKQVSFVHKIPDSSLIINFHALSSCSWFTICHLFISPWPVVLFTIYHLFINPWPVVRLWR